MNITITIFAQILTFVLLVWFVKAILWGPMTRIMEERKKKIAEGLAAAERGRHEQALAERKALEEMRKAKQRAVEIISLAQKRASGIIEEAKETAIQESDRVKTAAEAELEQEINRAREQLRQKVADLALLGASKVLEREVDITAHQQALDKLVAQL